MHTHTLRFTCSLSSSPLSLFCSCSCSYSWLLPAQYMSDTAPTKVDLPLHVCSEVHALASMKPHPPPTTFEAARVRLQKKMAAEYRNRTQKWWRLSGLPLLCSYAHTVRAPADCNVDETPGMYSVLPFYFLNRRFTAQKSAHSYRRIPCFAHLPLLPITLFCCIECLPPLFILSGF